MHVDTLIDTYYEEAMEGIDLKGFILKAVEGAYGTPERQVLLHFLDRMEAIILGNISTKWEEGPGLEVDQEAVTEATHQEFDEVREVVLQHLRP